MFHQVYGLLKKAVEGYSPGSIEEQKANHILTNTYCGHVIVCRPHQDERKPCREIRFKWERGTSSILWLGMYFDLKKNLDAVV